MCFWQYLCISPQFLVCYVSEGFRLPCTLTLGELHVLPRQSLSVWLKVWFGECLLYKGSMGQGVLPLPSSYALKLLWCLSPIQPGLPRMFRVGFGFSDRRNP